MKYKLKNLLAVATITLTINVNAQPQLIEKVEPKADGSVIPYEKWKLPNGLRLIIHEDHSDPIIHVSVTYKVGSDRESIGISGFAHFFEHMMFQGSGHVKDEEHFKLVSGAGGNMNGNTTSDRTFYYENLPSNQLEMALWLESDRMGFLLDSLTSKKFENQRDAVKNEKSQNQVNVPYGMVGEYMGQTLYPQGHPYNWPVIGYVDDLDRAKLEDVKNFFLRWYGPNNAILTVAGDVDSKQVLQLTEKYFGTIKPCPEVKKLSVPPPILPANKYFSYKDDIGAPLSYRVYPTVPQYHRDEAALELLADMMGGGNNSIFYKNFVKNEFAYNASVGYNSQELCGEFSIEILADIPENYNYEKQFNLIDEKIKATLEEFEKTGITDEALTRVKGPLDLGGASSTSSIFRKASLLSEWDRLLAPKPFNLPDELDRYRKVTKEDIVRVFNRYIKGAGAAIVNVYPFPPPPAPRDSIKSVNPYAGMEIKADPQYTGLTYNRAVDNFDRNIKPIAPSGQGKPAVLPDYSSETLSNGLKIMHTKNSEVSTIYLQLQIEGGNLVLTGDEIKKNGVAELTAEMMNEGTKNYTTEQISAELQKLGSNISFNADKQYTTVSVLCLKKDIDATLKLLEEKLLNPRFDPADFKLAKKHYKQNLRQELKSPNNMMSRAIGNELYGNTILGLFPTIKNIDRINVEDLKNYYEKYYSPSVAHLVIVGDIEAKEIMPKLDFLNKWQKKDFVMPPISNVSAVTEPRICIVDKPFAASSLISLAQVSLPYDVTGDFFKNNVVNYVLSGNFNSRINLNLREEKGYTYGIYGGFRGSKYAGSFGLGGAFKRREAANSLIEIFKETNNYIKNGIKEEEIIFTQNSLLNSDVLNYETPAQKAGFLSFLSTYNLNKDYKAKQAQVIKDMTKEDFNAQIKKAYDPSKMVIVIVGDKEIVKGQLDKMNLKTVKDYNENLNVKNPKILEVN